MQKVTFALIIQPFFWINNFFNYNFFHVFTVHRLFIDIETSLFLLNKQLKLCKENAKLIMMYQYGWHCVLTFKMQFLLLLFLFFFAIVKFSI